MATTFSTARGMAFLGRQFVLRCMGINHPANRGITAGMVRTFCSEADDVDESSTRRNSNKPERLVVDAETSIRYMDSDAYKEAYGDKPVWFYYRRNFKGSFAPETRKTCIRHGRISTGSPCPICRDEYLILDEKNVKLLEQFVSPYTGEVLETIKTGICQTQHRKLLVEVMKAQDSGLLEKEIPFREYDYSQYWDADKGKVLV